MVVECMVSMMLLDIVNLAKGAVGVGITIVVSSEDYRKEWYTYLTVIIIIARCLELGGRGRGGGGGGMESMTQKLKHGD